MGTPQALQSLPQGRASANIDRVRMHWRATAIAPALLLTLAAAGPPPVVADSAMPPVASDAPGCPTPSAKGSAEWPGQHRWQALERAGYRLGRLRIDVRDVYRGPRLAWYQRVANTLHIDTQPEVIRSLVRLETGEPVAAQSIYRAERRLREQAFATGARIVPTRCRNGRVDAAVRVRDAWTLQVGASFGTAGGASSIGFGFQDDNFLGTGTSLLLDWRNTPKRTTRELGYRDPALLGSQWTLDVAYSQLSDGRGAALGLDYPFRRIEQDWSVRVDARARRTELDFEQSSDTAYRTQVHRGRHDVLVKRLAAYDGHTAWRVGGGWRREYDDYGALEALRPELRPEPELADRRLQGPYLVVERVDERYRSFRNLRSIGRTRDYALGLDARLELGRFDDRLDDTDPWFTDVELDYGLALGERELLLAELNLSGRYRSDGVWRSHNRGANLDYYLGTSARNTWVAHLELDWRQNPDPADELYLGGFDGLLAYPERFRVGDRRWLLHLEDRYVSDVVLLDTIQVGYTGYLEAGGIRGLDGRWGRTLANVGAGLRLGSLRSSFGSVTYLTVAAPLVDVGDAGDYAFVVGSTVNF